MSTHESTAYEAAIDRGFDLCHDRHSEPQGLCDECRNREDDRFCQECGAVACNCIKRVTVDGFDRIVPVMP